MPDRTSPAFDRCHLERQTFGDRDLRRELLRLFADQCERLRPLVASEDVAVSREAAHALKGAAQALGAFRVAALCQIVETAPAGDVGRRSAGTELRTAIAAALEAVAAETGAAGARAAEVDAAETGAAKAGAAEPVESEARQVRASLAKTGRLA